MRKSKRKAVVTRVPKPATIFHHTEPYLLNPQHPVTVTVIGCGGTGSQMLSQLARLNVALITLGHPGLQVTAYDDDLVTEANMARQLFSKSELNMNKATAIVSRINRFFGFGWVAIPEQFKVVASAKSNIIITCVDSAEFRVTLSKNMRKGDNDWRPDTKPFYWLDTGNTRTSGQVVLGTVRPINQPKRLKNTVKTLPCITDIYPDLEKHDTPDQGPSCSLAEALVKQDLYINSIIAQFGANLLWKLFRELKLQYHGAFINLQTMTTNPLTVSL